MALEGAKFMKRCQKPSFMRLALSASAEYLFANREALVLPAFLLELILLKRLGLR